MQTIIEVMQAAESALHLHQIVNLSKQPEHVVRAFIREQSAFENVTVVPTRGRHGNRYEWTGPIEPQPVAGVDIDAIDRENLEPTADELEGLPDELLAELELPDAVAVQPENANLAPRQAGNEPITNEPQVMTKDEISAAALEPQAEAPAIAELPVSPKIGYMITAAQGKIERRKSHEAAKRLAGRWAKNGHKNIVIHLTSEQERVRIKPEVQFSRA